MKITDVIYKIKNKQYAKMPKLLHSFWEELWTLTKGEELPLEELSIKIQELHQPNLESFDFPPENSRHYNCKDTLNIGPHFLEIIELMKKPKNDTIWFVSNTSHNSQPTEKWANDRMNAQKMIDTYGPKETHCGLIFKDAIVSGEFFKLLAEIKKHHVVVIGMKHLEQTSLPFNYQFIPVKMPLRQNLSELKNTLEQNHKRFNQETVIYLSQMSTDGTTIVCNANLPNSFFIDMGRVLDVFADKDTIAKPQPWLDEIPKSLMEIYEKPNLAII